MQGATRRGTHKRKVAGCKWLGREANAAQQRWKKCTEMLVELLPLHIYPRLPYVLCDRSSSFKTLLGAPHENLLPLWSNLTKTDLGEQTNQINQTLCVGMPGAFKTILWSRALSLRRRWFDSTIYLSVTGCWRKAFKYAKKGGLAHNTPSSLNSGANAPQELRDVKNINCKSRHDAVVKW